MYIQNISIYVKMQVSFKLLGVLAVLIFILQFFSLIRPHGIPDFNDKCPANSNGCIRVNKFNQYRANNIEMRLPVTFKQTPLDQHIKDWIHSEFGDHASEITTSNNNDNIIYTLLLNDKIAEGQANNTFVAKETYYYFYHSTWYGLVIDTLITVHDCVQVFKAQTVTMQSQTRVGFKDYGRNYHVSSSFYNHLNTKVVKEGLKSFISCT